MNTTGWIVLVVGIVAIVVIGGLVVTASREGQHQDQHHAAELRAQGQASALDARQHEAEAASMQAETDKIQIESERLRQAAQDMRAEAADHHMRATEELDPHSTPHSGRSTDPVSPIDPDNPRPDETR